VFRVGIGDDAQRLVAECELGVTEERLVGGGDEASCHFQDGAGGSGLDAGREFLGLGFQFGAEGFRHRDLLPE
jgi:hypothetical protein